MARSHTSANSNVPALLARSERQERKPVVRRVATLSLPVLFAATLIAPAASAASGDCRLIRGTSTPSDTTDDVSVCRHDVWIHRAATPVGNLAGVGADASPFWNTTKPTSSMQQGA